jgi:internalin A
MPERERGSALSALRERIAYAAATRASNLDLSNLGLTSLPPEIGGLTELVRLDLSFNQLTSLPPEIGPLIRLNQLDLSENRITTLPKDIGRLTALEELKVRANQLTSLPPEIGRLTRLKQLLLGENRITGLPPEIGRLSELRVLWLWDNQITSLSPEIGGLTALESLFLHNNQLTHLPAEIRRLTKLAELDLSENRFTSLPPEISRLTALQWLLLNCNQLARLPPEIGQLTHLRRLDLSEMRLTSLPPEIGRLTELVRLDVRNTLLTRLPPEISRLTALRHLHLGDTPLKSPPLEVVSQGSDAIRAYLRELDKAAIPLYEAKVVLAGEPDVGKTTLKERLINDRFATPRSTRGLELGTKEIDHPAVEGATITFNFWDFGGQEDYRPAQQLFFSEAALYLLVWHARHDVAQARLENWLRLVSYRTGGKARVIVAATHGDKFTPTGNVTRLSEAFPGLIAGYITVDNDSGNGIGPLWQMILKEVQGLEDFGAERPRAWVEARNAILGGAAANGRQQIPFDEFKAAAIERGVEPETVKVFATMLSNQGRLVYHGDDLALAGTVILDPEWLMKAIAYLVQDEVVRNNGGVLLRSRLAAIWRDHGRPAEENPNCYDEHQWNFLLELMAEQNIVYKLSGREWLVPALAPAERPADLPWDGRSSDRHGEPLRLECRLDEPLPGLMALMTVRNHFYHADRRYSWRSGVFLRDPYRGDEARIEEAGGDTHIAIAVRGATRWALMDHLMGGLEQLINEKWPAAATTGRKPYHFLFPCPTGGCEGHFDREALLTDLKSGEKTAKCSNPRGRHAHSIHRLLLGLPMPGGFGPEGSLERVYEGINEIIQRMDRSAGALAEIQSEMALLLRYNSDEAPRIYSLKAVETSRWDPRRLLGQRVQITIWCEELKAPVEGATRIVTLDPVWLGHLHRHGPMLHKLVSAAAIMGAAVKAVRGIVAVDLDELREATGKIVKAAADWNDGAAGRDAEVPWTSEDLSGHPIARAGGTPLKAEVAADLRKAAENGHMKQIIVNNVWSWVCPAVAIRRDPAVEKE